MIFVNFIWLLNFGRYCYNLKNTEKKAKIKAHSDKTKDMPQNATIAFCTFYESFENNKFNYLDKKNNIFDYYYGNCSVLTRLYFKLKADVNDKSLAKEFSITLYPNSVFLIPLSTNRLYTHEIRPSSLPIDKIPTRMGYVIRCSNTKAIFENEQTYIVEKDNKIKLEYASKGDIIKVKDLYFRENTTTDKISYDNIYFSFNAGDYLKPIL